MDQRIVLNNYRAGELLKLPKLGELKVKWSQVPGGVFPTPVGAFPIAVHRGLRYAR